MASPPPPALPLEALTWPEAPGAAALRPVLARHARGTVRALFDLARRPWPPPLGRDVAALMERLGRLPRRRLTAITRHVWISGPVRVAQADAGRGAWGPAGEALAEALLPLATSLPGPPLTLHVPPRQGARGPAVLWPGRGARARLPPDTRRVRLRWATTATAGATAGADGAAPEVVALGPGGDERGPARWEAAVLDAAPAGRLALADNNPLRGDEAHPDKAGNRLDLGGASPGTWIRALRAARALVAVAAPALADELALGVQHWVPVGVDPERHLSASFQEVVGLAYLSLHASPASAPGAGVALRPGAELVLLEAMVHELQHNKLNAALDAGPLLVNAFSPLYASPVRPDPRPLHGVLLAAHAFVPVERVYDRLGAAGHPAVRGPEAGRRLARVRAANDEAMETLARHAQWTEAGAALWRGLQRAHAQGR